MDGAQGRIRTTDNVIFSHVLFYLSYVGQSSDYRMAAGQDPRLSELIAQMIVGEPFDAAQERALKTGTGGK